MEVDLISAGPSAKHYQPSDRIKVGINSAGLLFELDYLVILDYEFYKLHKDNFKGDPTIVTCGNHARKLDNAGIEYFYTKYGDIERKYKPVEYSYLAALYFTMKELCATKINYYGIDKTGYIDCAGQSNSKGRSVNRWIKETECEALLRQYMQII